MTAELLRRLFTVDHYHRMIEAGILAEGDRVELIRGEIIEMAAIGAKHAACVNRLNRLFSKLFGDDVLVGIQNPIELDQYSEPQPDIALLRPREDFYAARHPQPEDVFLLIEVSDSTIRYDRTIKVPLYAEDGIAEVWLIDVNGDAVEVYRQPMAKGYQSVQMIERGQSVSLLAFPEVAIAVDEILG
jgi:Uma2 family endonuclease